MGSEQGEDHFGRTKRRTHQGEPGSLVMKAGTVCADTSFLFSIYNNNEHTTRAIRLLRALGKPISISVVGELELSSALRFSEFTGEIPKGSAKVFLERFQSDLINGQIERDAVDLNAVFAKANEISERYVIQMGVRSYDMLHVASALVMGAKQFLTFDRVQQKLAVAEGLKSPW